MKLVVKTPSRMELQGFETKIEEVRSVLTYVDLKVKYNLKKLRAKRWTWDMEGWQIKIDELTAKEKPCLLFEDEDGTLWTYPGLADTLAFRFKPEIVSEVEYPDTKVIPWSDVPPPLYYYQQEAVDRLIQAHHGAISLATGGGKSYIAMWLAKHFALKTIVMVPSESIAEQMYDDFSKHFGKKYVGKYWGGKHDHKKLITIGISNSLTRIEKGTEEYESLSKTQVFIADECHLTPAETLQAVCFGLCGESPYRFFVSGTVTRTDGSELLLHAITGKVVFTKTVKELVDEGFLAKPIFRMVETTSSNPGSWGDPNAEVKNHFLLNPNVLAKAAQIANAAIERLDHPTLILIDEFCQFKALLPYLRHKCGFAFGGRLTKDNEQFVPPEYRKADNKQLVKDFNEGRLQLLIGTSAISTGTNIKPVKTMINLMGGKSVIATSQAVGRCTRKGADGQKQECFVFDFDVGNNETCHRHAIARSEIYNSIYAPVVYV